MDLIGHEAIVRELRSLAEAGDPPHAILLAGPEGTGRRALAQHLAQLLNCERAPGAPQGGLGFDLGPTEGAWPCETCRSCRLIAEGTHPDFITFSPGDALCRPRANESSHDKHPLSRDIRICQVRGIIDTVARFPFESRYRVLLIDPAERLAEAAANALLKTLEEPPGHTVFALASAAPEALIETIRSRCRRINVRTVPRAEIEAGLLARGIEPSLAARVASESRGRPARAIAFAAKPDLMGDRERLLERCGRVAAGSLAERFRYAEDLARRWRNDREAVLAEVDLWEAYWEEALRETSREPGHGGVELAPAVAALKAVMQAKEDLRANVLARAVFDLMLISFPRRTLAGTAQGAAPLND